jgi:RimJ/RimL family protein N-acetyltransferase
MSMLSQRTVDIVDAYWAHDLGCSWDALRARDPRLQIHGGGLAGYPGVFVLVVGGGAPLVSAPPDVAGALATRIARFTAEAVARPSVLGGLLAPTEVARIIGPAQLEYADAASFKPWDLARTRELRSSDGAEVAALKATCHPAEWDLKGFDLEARRTFGAFGDQGELLAIADFEVWAGRLAHLGVVTRPQARGHGHGPAAIAAACACALDAGLVLQYRALRENHASLRLAAKLGFQAYGWTIAARFAD